MNKISLWYFFGGIFIYISKRNSTLTENDRSINNENFIKDKLIEYKDYFDNIYQGIDDNIMLDKEQRKAILIDEDYNMIIAGAGSGKTTTISAKVKYLVEKLNIKEEEIVVISFTNKAVSELKERINRDFNLNILICTFHHLAISLVKDKKSVCTNSYDILKYFFYNVLYNDNETLNLFLKYYKEYINVPLYVFNFKSINDKQNK